MRLWTLHPRHLDTKGLVALWRESLLARSTTDPLCVTRPGPVAPWEKP